MRIIKPSCVALLFFLCACAGLQNEVRNELPPDAAMTGLWLPVSADLSGKKFDFVKDFRLQVNGAHFVTLGGTKRDEGRIVFLDGEPRGIDVIGESGPNKGQRLPAIYRYKGGEMEICYDLSGKERPTEFVSKANTQLFRITYKRGK